MSGKFIVARIPALDRENLVLVRLHKVEVAGIWIESKAIQIRKCLALSETALGLEE